MRFCNLFIERPLYLRAKHNTLHGVKVIRSDI